MKRFRFLLGIIIGGGFLLVGLMTWHTLGPPNEKSEMAKEPPPSADLQLDRVRYTETREGIIEWELEATCAQYFKEENTVFFDQVKATFFGKSGATYVLVGERGKFNTQTKAIELFNGTRLDSSDGYHMRTQSLKYQAEKRVLTTSDAVEMTGPQFRVEGVGLVVELDRQRLRVLRQVTTTLTQPVGKKTSRSAM